MGSIFCDRGLYDLKHGKDLAKFISNQISKWSAAYFDEGQALWKTPTENLTFYSWWKSLAQYDRANQKIGSKFFELVKGLPEKPEDASLVLSRMLLKKCSINEMELSNYYYRLLFTCLGWSSFFQKYEFEAGRTGNDSLLKSVGGVIDILTVRMVYDIALLDQIEDLEGLNLRAKDQDSESKLDLLYIWLCASELAYRKSVESSIAKNRTHMKAKTSIKAQMVFCIDVRSEVIRRHIELVSPHIETKGFAGFFGLPLSFKKLGHSQADHHCPVLLNSTMIVEEYSKTDAYLPKKRQTFIEKIFFNKTIQTSINSGFTFVETLGLSYIAKMIRSAFCQYIPNLDFQRSGLNKTELSSIELNTEKISLDSKVSLAYGALKNMGLTKNFAEFVFFIGHGSQSANNPYASALDCGACAGHSGHSNSMLLAQILNEKSVRLELQNRNIVIPDSTLFISGWHNTTTDELFFDRSEYSTQKTSEFSELKSILSKASENSRLERAKMLSFCSELDSSKIHQEFKQKATDWSEIRPEWGLARNASFIVARRELTRTLNLEGRSFLHDYDSSDDFDLSKLELIMTAPMIVTNWINMQYYASTVDPEKFGAGNKVLNNVVGGIACIQGNESDLLTGLTEQSVWHKGDYFHEPLRLQVFIEASTVTIDKIIKKHQMVRELIVNKWLNIISIDPSTGEFKLYGSNGWIKERRPNWN